jgi:NAD-dependent dihydropyrimidine dehydrogenase PreA subunit
MAIGPSFENTHEEVNRHENHRAWTTDGEEPMEDKQGIHGTHVAVDFAICIADGACLEDSAPLTCSSGPIPLATPSPKSRPIPPMRTSASTVCSVSMSALSTPSTLTRDVLGGSEPREEAR